MSTKEVSGNRFLACTVLLTLFGLIMTYSSSWAYSDMYYGNSYYLLLKQTIAAAIGFTALVALSKIDYRWLVNRGEIFLLGFLVLTTMTFLPALSEGGRWLDFGPIIMQPTEGLKFALILWIALTINRKGDKLKNFSEGILPFFVVLGGIAVFTLAQPDFSMTMLYAATIVFILFIAGAKVVDLGKIFAAGMPLFGGLLIMEPYRLERLVSFLNPLKDKMDSGYQLMQSLMAFGSGGALGRGLGQSAEKFFYLPSAYNDFIFAIIGEELGFLGAVLVISGFAYLAFHGFRLALNTEDPIGVHLASGITFILVFQALINFAVTVGIMPVTGLTLPFLSYGGSSLIISLAMVGTLLNISKT